MNETTDNARPFAPGPPPGGAARYLSQGWLVLALALCFGGALAGVEARLKGRIERNKAEFIRRAVLGIVPQAASAEQVGLGGMDAYMVFGPDGRHVGWAVPGAGEGYAGRIELLVGLDASGERLTGLAVVQQRETPGLGNKIEGEKFTRRFAGLDARREVSVTKAAPSGNEIAPVTSATVSSRSVCDIVNRAVRAFRRAHAASREQD
jgi:electron transport complex protein RnfG